MYPLPRLLEKGMMVVVVAMVVDEAEAVAVVGVVEAGVGHI
jgi:hypothetical protein